MCSPNLSLCLSNDTDYSWFFQIGMLKELCGLCEEKDVDIRITTKKLAMVSLLTIFKDIIPGYGYNKS